MGIADKPWMKLYVGDWIRDTVGLSPGARGVLAQMRCHMRLQELKGLELGVITGVITDIEFLLGFRYNTVLIFLEELSENKVIELEKLPGKIVRITDAYVIKQVKVSRSNSANGKKGMEIRYNKNDDSVITNDITNVIASSDTLISNDSDNDFKREEGAGGRETKWGHVQADTVLVVDECLMAFLDTDICGSARDVILMTKCAPLAKMVAEGKPRDRIWEWGWLLSWGKVFNQQLTAALHSKKTLADWSGHFHNWIKNKDTSKDPEKLYIHEPNGSTNGTGAKAGERPTKAIPLRPGDSFY